MRSSWPSPTASHAPPTTHAARSGPGPAVRPAARPAPWPPARAGEDDAEDAQWLVVLTDTEERLDPKELDDFAAEWDGWREEP
ncbi:hypothetical protein EAO69_38225 [Streptomyces sp. me109]|nr:hypothetical protein EAO69_38225 [Streptomyces sp. me109]